jgi:NAD(P)-dependent dehydrogenase (short-subunit alcohol dehydrogenase family)
MRFQNNVAFVTGGGSGIGLETANRLHAEGAVLLNGRDEAKLRSAAEEIGTSQRVSILAADVAKVTTGHALVQASEKQFGGIDILINNAGVFKPIPFADVTEEQYDWFLDTILKGKFFAAQAVAKSMKKRGGAAIVNTGSMWALQAVGATPSSAYSAANAGVHALARNLAIELAPHKIRVNAVAPAVVETPVYSTFLSDRDVAKVLPTFDAFHPLGRNGQPADIAAMILFLASEEASWVTGTTIPIDGGVMAGRNQ